MSPPDLSSTHAATAPISTFEVSANSIAAAAGWLAGRAAVVLGDRAFRDRVVSALVYTPRRLDIGFLTALDLDIRRACQRAGRPAPRLSQFFRGHK